MKTIELLKNIEHAGLVEGDVLTVDDLSAAGMIDRGVAKEYEPETVAAEAAEPSRYGGEESRTIDDIHDPRATRMKGVQSLTIVADADPGPRAATVAEAETPKSEPRGAVVNPLTKSTTRVASGAQPAGGDADGGAAGS